MLVGAVGLALQNVFFKVAYRTGASATAIGLGRFTLGALALWVYVVARYSRGNFPVRLPLQSLLTLLLLASVAYFLSALTYLVAITYLPVALATFLAYMYPAFATLIAVSLGRDRMTRTLGLALLITLTGVSLMLGGPAGISIHGSKWLGVVLIVGNAIAYAIYIVGSEWTLRTVHSITATA